MPGFVDMTREEKIGFFLALLFTVVAFALTRSTGASASGYARKMIVTEPTRDAGALDEPPSR